MKSVVLIALVFVGICSACYPPDCGPVPAQFSSGVLTNEAMRHKYRGQIASMVGAKSSHVKDNGQWFNYSQTIDHTGGMSGKFNQRYFVQDASTYQPGGPIFLYLGGEGPAEMFLGEVQMQVWAEQFGAKFILLEHRYYGDSNPVPDFSTPNMQFLTADQALADASSFLLWYNTTLSTYSNWMIFGCSYSGMLSSWFRQRYPDLVVGSYGPSGPVLAQSNYTGYMWQFGQTAGPDCSAALTAASAAFSAALAQPNGLSDLGAKFNTCAPLTQNDAFNFQFTIAVTIAGAAQEDLPPNFQVNQICALLQAALPVDPVERLANAFFLANGGPGSCNDFSDADFVASVSNPALSANYDGSRAWWYQKCTEFGYFKTSFPGSNPFNFDLPLDHFLNWCGQIFTPGMTPNTTGINAEFGALNPDSTRVVITQGALDPWHLLGIVKNSTSTSVYSYLYEAGHCAPLHQATPFDPPTVLGAREYVGSFISAWLADPTGK